MVGVYYPFDLVFFILYYFYYYRMFWDLSLLLDLYRGEGRRGEGMETRRRRGGDGDEAEEERGGLYVG
jgi:hypothetical protein